MLAMIQNSVSSELGFNMLVSITSGLQVQMALNDFTHQQTVGSTLVHNTRNQANVTNHLPWKHNISPWGSETQTMMSFAPQGPPLTSEPLRELPTKVQQVARGIRCLTEHKTDYQED